MKKLCYVFLILILFTSVTASGQYGARQAGVRTGYRGGIFYQAKNEAGNAEVAYNLMLGFSDNGIQVTGLRIVYETSLSDISSDLYLGWGYGGHIGFINTDHLGFLGERYDFRGERFCPLLGADGWLAVEYRFNEILINISLNVKPFVELTFPSFVKVMPVDLGISVSYTF